MTVPKKIVQPRQRSTILDVAFLVAIWWCVCDIYVTVNLSCVAIGWGSLLQNVYNNALITLV